MEKQQSVAISKNRFWYALKITDNTLENFYANCQKVWDKMNSTNKKRYVTNYQREAIQDFRELQRNLNKSKKMKYGILNFYCSQLNVAPEYVIGSMLQQYDPLFEIMRHPYKAENRIDPDGFIIPLYKESELFSTNTEITEQVLALLGLFGEFGFYDDNANTVFYFDREDFENDKHELSSIIHNSVQNYLIAHSYLKHDFHPDTSSDIRIIE